MISAPRITVIRGARRIQWMLCHNELSMSSISPNNRQSAKLFLQAHPLKLRASVHVTPAGLLGISVLVSSILLMTGVIVAIAGDARSKRH